MAEKQRIEVAFLDAQMKVYSEYGMEEEAEYGQLLNKREDLLAKHAEQNRRYSLREIEQEHEDRVDGMTALYNDLNSVMYHNEEAYRHWLLTEDIRYLEEKQSLYEETSEEWLEIQREIDKRIFDEQVAYQQKLADAYEKWFAEYGQQSGGEREEKEISTLKSLREAGLITEQQYAQAVNDVKQKYREIDIDNARRTNSEHADMVVELFNAYENLFQGISSGAGFSFDDLSEAATATFAVLSSMAQSYTSYMNAERDAEIAKVEARYDKEIEAAGNNTKKKEQLEKQKEEETAKIKKKYNDRAMKIELAQAIAQTAQAALAAYASAAAIPVTGWIMAPIAASLATAAGLVQIATIKKQHEAEAAGYYSGGFTRRSWNDHEEAGVVHANEFVANHQAVANPELSPVLRLIDYAQRNNTVGSLTAADVSNALGQGAGVSARGEVATSDTSSRIKTNKQSDTVMRQTSEAIARLNDNLEQGIEAIVTIDGERGFDSQYRRYRKLKSNTQR